MAGSGSNVLFGADTSASAVTTATGAVGTGTVSSISTDARAPSEKPPDVGANRDDRTFPCMCLTGREGFTCPPSSESESDESVSLPPEESLSELSEESEDPDPDDDVEEPDAEDDDEDEEPDEEDDDEDEEEDDEDEDDELESESLPESSESESEGELDEHESFELEGLGLLEEPGLGGGSAVVVILSVTLDVALLDSPRFDDPILVGVVLGILDAANRWDVTSSTPTKTLISEIFGHVQNAYHRISRAWAVHYPTGLFPSVRSPNEGHRS